MGGKEFDIMPAETDEKLIDKPEFDITPDAPDEALHEKEWDINIPEENEAPEEAPKEKPKAPDPLSVQPEWYDNVRKGLPSTPGAESEPEVQEEASHAEAENKNEGVRYVSISENYLKSKYDAPEQVREEAEKVIAEMPEEDRVSLAKGVVGFGYKVQEFKGKVFSKAFKWAADKLEEKSFGNRLFESYGEIYDNLADRAHTDRERFNKEGGAVKGLKSAAILAGNVAMWGRTVIGVGSPLGSITAAAMFAGKGGEAVKEAHLKSEEVIEEGRVHDIDEAAQEAQKLYEEAKEKSADGVITAGELQQAYKERLPQDLLDRLSKDAQSANFISKCTQWIAHKNIEHSAQKIKEKLDEIENNGAFSKEAKEKAKARVATKYDKFLRDMDRIVGNGGTVDMIAYGSRLVEKGGTIVAAGMALETIGEGILHGVRALDVLETDLNETREELVENIPLEQNNEDAVREIFGSFSERMVEGGVAPDDVALAEQAAALGLGSGDFDEFQGDTVQLSQLMTGVQELSLGGNEANIMKAILAHQEVAEKLDNADVRDLLSHEVMSVGHEEDILNAENVAVVGKGESISEVLGIDMSPEMKVMVVNPDGTELEDFDANLVHQGDTVVQNADGTVTVFKTSDVAVGPGHSLQGIYDSIKEGLDEKGIPSEVQNALNQGEGHWEGQISRAEASEIEETWNLLKADFDTMEAEGKNAFLGKLSKGMTGEEISKALHEQLVSGQELTTEEIPPDVREQFIDAEGKRMAAETMEKVYTPEQIENAKIPGETDGPPIDGKTPEERIAPDAWSESIRKGGRYEVHDDVLDDDSEAQEQAETPSREVAPPGHLPETPAHVENHTSETVLKTGENEYIYNGPTGDFKGKFSYNENNEIVGFRHEGGTKVGGAGDLEDSVLKEGWREKLLGRKGGAYLAEQQIKTTAHDLGIRQRILTAMEKAGEKDTKEYQFLKKTIATRIERLEKTYGDIFK